MHQTGSSSAVSTLTKYKNPAAEYTGAHFLLDKDGTMYQTLQVTHRAAQVAPINSRCLDEKRCSVTDLKAYDAIEKIAHSKWNGTYHRALGRYEAKKSYPDRYPWNPDAIGIEVVGPSLKNPDGSETGSFEKPTPQQTTYLHWFVRDLMSAMKLTPADICRHPQLSAKQKGEAADVTW